MDRFGEVWRRFAAERRLEFGGHEDPEWQDGHALSASLMVRADAAGLRDRLAPPREALRPFPFVTLLPDRFMHVTLFLLGFLADEPRGDGEVSRERLRGISGDARRALAGFAPFEVRLANVNAFPGAAFVEVHDGGELDGLREALSVSCGLREPAGPPHLTLAYFEAPDGTPAPEELVSAIDLFRDWPVGELLVEAVELTLLDVREDFPAPETLHRMPLGGRRPVANP